MRKSLDNIKKLSKKQLVGYEQFIYKDELTDLTILEYWRWHYSDIYDLQDSIAEYIVCKALGLTEAQNVGNWTLFDLTYRGKRIEIKETSYYHSWQSDEEPKSKTRVFGITKAYSVYQDNTSVFERQNDIYVFCLNTGYTKKESNPLQLKNWEFYVIPTWFINMQCGEAKSLSLSRIRNWIDPIDYKDLKISIDGLIDNDLGFIPQNK